MEKLIRKIRDNIRQACEERPKCDVTREKIMAAARRVFARHAFHAASIRMIAVEGRFAHGIIRYHFPNKAVLFEAIVREACEDFYRRNRQWLGEIADMPLKKSFSEYMDRLLAYNNENPWALQMVNQNLAQADKVENTPGYEHILNLMIRTRRQFSQALASRAQEDVVNRFSDAFNGLVFHFLGASSCQSQILKMDPMSREYALWVKKTMEIVFLPVLENIFYSRGAHKNPKTT
jgi:AcrR family transcriptional regulator